MAATIRDKELALVQANLLRANERLNQMLSQSPDEIDNQSLYAIGSLIERLKNREVELRGRRVRFSKMRVR